jgi:hypothetical protein
MILQQIGKGMKGMVGAGAPGRAKAAEESAGLLRGFSPSGLRDFWGKLEQNPTLKNRFLQYLQRGSLDRRQGGGEPGMTQQMPPTAAPTPSPMATAPPQAPGRDLWASFPQPPRTPFRQNPWPGGPWGL